MLIRRRPLRAHALTVMTSAAVLALGGCTSSGDGESGDDKAGPRVIAPGKPGEQARTLSPKEAAKNGEDDTPNSADFAYVRMMMVHHEQALTMTELVPDRVRSTQVKRLAERITAAQGPEIDAMRGWLKRYGAKEHQHGDAPMPGMATEAQLKSLRAAQGKAFDELFLKLMITHHDGALTMATDVLSQGNNIQVEEMAGDVVAQQTSEINRMRGMS